MQTIIIIFLIVFLAKRWDSVEEWCRVAWYDADGGPETQAWLDMPAGAAGVSLYRVTHSGGIMTGSKAYYIGTHPRYRQQSSKTQIAVAKAAAQRVGISVGRITRIDPMH